MTKNDVYNEFSSIFSRIYESKYNIDLIMDLAYKASQLFKENTTVRILDKLFYFNIEYVEKTINLALSIILDGDKKSRFKVDMSFSNTRPIRLYNIMICKYKSENDEGKILSIGDYEENKIPSVFVLHNNNINFSKKPEYDIVVYYYRDRKMHNTKGPSLLRILTEDYESMDLFFNNEYSDEDVKVEAYAIKGTIIDKEMFIKSKSFNTICNEDELYEMLKLLS